MKKNLFKNTFGFGLVEVLMAAGIAGGIALTIAKLSQDANKVTKSTEANNEINMMMNDVAYILSDKANCIATIPPGTNTSGANITGINRLTNGTQRTVYQTGTKYGNGTFSIGSIVTESIGPNDVNLILSINRENKVTTGAKAITKRIPLKVVTTGATIDSCFSDTESIITSAAERACRGAAARWDASSGTCHHDVTPIACQSYEAIRASTAANGVITYTCAPVFNTSCGAGSYIHGWDANGEPRCGGLQPANNCSAGQYTRTLTNGSLVCVDIPKCGVQGFLRSNSSSGEIECQSLPCNSTNQYFAGFNSFGSPVCKNFPDRTCGAGQYIKEVRPNGSVICEDVPTSTQGIVAANEYLRGYAADGTKVAGTIETCTGANHFTYFNGTRFTCGNVGGGAWQLLTMPSRLAYTPSTAPTKAVEIDYDGKIIGRSGARFNGGDIESDGLIRARGFEFNYPYTDTYARIINSSGEQYAKAYIEFRMDNQPMGGGSLEVGVGRPNGSGTYTENNAGYLYGNTFMPSIGSNKPLVPTPTNIYGQGFVYPGLGKSSYRWANIFLSSSPNVSSDKRLKKDIKESNLGLRFIESLKSVSFKLINDNKMGNKIKYGLIAQDVEKSLETVGVKPFTTEIVTKDDNGFLGMSYESLISPIIKAIQELSDKVDNLFNGHEKSIKALEERMIKLEKENQALKAELKKSKK